MADASEKVLRRAKNGGWRPISLKGIDVTTSSWPGLVEPSLLRRGVESAALAVSPREAGRLAAKCENSSRPAWPRAWPVCVEILFEKLTHRGVIARSRAHLASSIAAYLIA